MQADPSQVPAGTILFDPDQGAHRALVAALPGFRAVAIDRAVGRDVRECRWLCVPDVRLLRSARHLKELLLQHRGKAVVVTGLCGESVDAERLADLRRYAGVVVAIEADGTVPAWSERITAQVLAADAPDVVALIERVVASRPAERGDVEAWLRDARDYVDGHEFEGAFQASARALAMAPDQPGVLADVARLLGLMGRSHDGRQLCRAYLLQRPDSAPVQRALAELEPAS